MKKEFNIHLHNIAVGFAFGIGLAICGIYYYEWQFYAIMLMFSLSRTK